MVSASLDLHLVKYSGFCHVLILLDVPAASFIHLVDSIECLFFLTLVLVTLYHLKCVL